MNVLGALEGSGAPWTTLRSGLTSLRRMHALLGLADRRHAGVELELSLEVSQAGVGFDLTMDEPQVIARFPMLETLAFLAEVQLGREELRVMKDDPAAVSYYPLAWAPEFTVRRSPPAPMRPFERSSEPACEKSSPPSSKPSITSISAPRR